MVLMLSRRDVQGLITMADAIDALRVAHAEFSRGDSAMPVRSVVLVPDHQGWYGIMPAYLPGSSALGLKSVTVYKDNPARGLPAIMGVILLLDPVTGTPLAVMDAGYLTGVRTAAASGVATDMLARRDARELAILGAGVQAKHHLVAMCAVRPIERVRVVSLTPESAERFRREMQSATAAHIEVVGSAEEAVRGADVVVCATTAKTPILKRSWLKPGAHVNGIGSHSPDARELPGELIASARVVVDSRDAALQEAGDLKIPIAEGLVAAEQVTDELGELVEDRKPRRTSPEQVTVYKSVGIAIQDMATAALVYRRVLASGAGTQVDLLS